MTNAQLFNKALSIISSKRQKAFTLALMRENELKIAVPMYESLNSQRTKLGASLGVLRASGADKSLIADTQAQLKELSEKLDSLLVAAGFSAQYAKPQFYCAICNDKGRINGEICECVRAEEKRLRREEMCAHSPLSLCGFDTFSLSKYPNKIIDGTSEREHMRGILNFCKNYAEDFSLKSSSLYLYGNAGLGKTHLALSIANEVLKKGFDVVYVSSQSVFDNLEKERFSQNSDTMNNLCHAQLLILDDLGTEFISAYTGSCIYDLINTRYNKSLPTIYTSNLTSESDLKKRYTEKIVSRLLGGCEVLPFFGSDIRIIDKEKG